MLSKTNRFFRLIKSNATLTSSFSQKNSRLISHYNFNFNKKDVTAVTNQFTALAMNLMQPTLPTINEVSSLVNGELVKQYVNGILKHAHDENSLVEKFDFLCAHFPAKSIHDMPELLAVIQQIDFGNDKILAATKKLFSSLDLYNYIKSENDLISAINLIKIYIDIGVDESVYTKQCKLILETAKWSEYKLDSDQIIKLLQTIKEIDLTAKTSNQLDLYAFQKMYLQNNFNTIQELRVLLFSLEKIKFFENPISAFSLSEVINNLILIPENLLELLDGFQEKTMLALISNANLVNKKWLLSATQLSEIPFVNVRDALIVELGAAKYLHQNILNESTNSIKFLSIWKQIDKTESFEETPTNRFSF